MRKVALITGASRGIGAACARLFAENGYEIAIGYRASEERAAALQSELRAAGFTAERFQADVADRAQAFAMVERVLSSLGRIDVLVNNAGVAQQKLFGDLTEADWDRMFAVNVKGAFHCAQAVLPQMLRRGEGVILNLSSIWGIAGASCEVHYSAAKAAVIGFTKALAKELGPSGVRVNCIAPGVIETDMNAQLTEETLGALREETPLGVIGRPEDVAHTALFLASPGARFLTGQVLSPNGGIVI